MSEWFEVDSASTLLAVFLSTVGIYAATVLFTRLAGLRSFSKMSGFDFAMTVAIGSIVASTILTKSPPLPQAIVALASVYLLQILVAVARKRLAFVEKLVDNGPMLLMIGDQMLAENLKRARVTEHDLWAKLREANVLDLTQVRAVVFENTGDISVLHGEEGGTPLAPELLTGVSDKARFSQSRTASSA